MSIFDFDEANQPLVQDDIQELPRRGSRWKAIKDFYDQMNVNYSTEGIREVEENARLNRLEKYREIVDFKPTPSDLLSDPFGNKLFRDVVKEFPEAKDIVSVQGQANALYKDPKTGQVIEFREAMDEYVDRFIEKKRLEDPEKYKDLKTSSEISSEIKDVVERTERRAAISAAEAPDDLLQKAGYFGAGMFATIFDRENLAMMGLSTITGNPAAAASRFMGRLKLIGTAVAENMAAEAISFPAIQKYQKKLGREYGMEEFVENELFAIGGTIGMLGAAKGIGVAYKKGVKPLAAAIEKPVSRALRWADIRQKFRDLGLGRASDEAAFLQKQSEFSEQGDITSRLITAEENNRAIDEVASAIEEGRPVDVSKLPEDAKLLDPEFAPRIKDPVLRAEFRDLAKAWREADGRQDLNAENAVELERKALEQDQRAAQGLVDDATIPRDAEAEAKIQLREARLNEAFADLEKTWESDPEWKMTIDGGKYDSGGFKMELDRMREISRALSVCGGKR